MSAHNDTPENDIPVHPIAELFPLLSDTELVDLAEDIRQHGLREPVMLYKDAIIDGRNRHKACGMAGVVCAYALFHGTDADALAYVVSKNLHRRHLDTSQRSMVAAKLANLQWGGDRKSDQSANLHFDSEEPLQEPPVSQRQAADMMHVSRRTVLQAKKVLDDGAPELQEAVERGEIPVYVAAGLTTLPEDEQREIVTQRTVGHFRAQFTHENEWYTPAQYITAATQVLGAIDLDPATNPQAQATIQATYFFTKDDDGLAQPWHGRVWLNPPYVQPLIAQFVDKLVREVLAQRVVAAILLTHNYTDTAWFHQAEAVAQRLCFTKGRIRFVDSAGGLAAPTQGQTFFYFGPDPFRFETVFGAFGFIR